MLELRLSADRPVAQVAVRLMDVLPDGAATRVSFGVLNLTHRDGHATPVPLVPGEIYMVRVPMKHIAQRFTPGHRVRVAISTSYFPLIWPPPEAATLTVHTAGSRLELPVRTASAADADLPEFPGPELAEPLAMEMVSPAGVRWHVTRDLIGDRVTMEVVDDPGTFRIVDNDLTIAKVGRERYSVGGDDPADVAGDVDWTVEFSRGAWRIRSVTETSLTSDASGFRIHARLRAWEGDDLVHEQEWDDTIPRHLV